MRTSGYVYEYVDFYNLPIVVEVQQISKEINIMNVMESKLTKHKDVENKTINNN